MTDYYTYGDKKLAEMLRKANNQEDTNMRCAKTGLTDQDFKTILDVLNMYDPNDVASAVPEMATPEFMQDVQSAFKAVLAHVKRINHRTADKPAVDTMSLAYQQWVHDS